MAFAPIHTDLIGCFRTAPRTYFEFKAASAGDPRNIGDMPHELFVCDGTTRFARVLKTVAYVVVDEAADGSPVIEKWDIKTDWRKT